MAALDSFNTNPVRVDLSDSTTRVIFPAATSSVPNRRITKIIGNAVDTAGSLRARLFHVHSTSKSVWTWWANLGAGLERRVSDDVNVRVSELWYAGSGNFAANSILLIYFE